MVEFGYSVAQISALYVADHLLFAMSITLITYFQTIAAPQDIAGSAGVSFSINHIAGRYSSQLWPVLANQPFPSVLCRCHLSGCFIETKSADQSNPAH